jgi:hypothetical protein
MSTAYVILTGFTQSGPPSANGLLSWQATVIDSGGSPVPSPSLGGPPVADTYQIQAGDTNASIAAAITAQVQADWGDDTITVTFVSPGS